MEKIEYFIQETNKRFDKIDARFDETHDKLDRLYQAKWRMEGGTITICAIISIAVSILTIVLQK